MFDWLCKLSEVMAVSGCENAMAARLQALAAPYGECTRDAMGNLFVHRPGPGRRVMLTAHMDTVGLIVTYTDAHGFVRFGPIGGLHPATLVNQQVVFADGARGVICAEAGVTGQSLGMEKLYLDPAGVSVHPGDPAQFAGAPLQQGDFVIAPYLDNRAGCAILLEVLSKIGQTDEDLWFVFTVQEELGTRGVKPAAFAVDPAIAVVVDTCGTGDVPGEPEHSGVQLGGGPVLKLMDQNAVAHPVVNAQLQQAAAQASVCLQPYVAKRGGTDAGAVVPSRGGVPTGILSVPTRYLHTPNEMVSLTDLAQCAQVLLAAFGG